jgi:hypothetical protein
VLAFTDREQELAEVMAVPEHVFVNVELDLEINAASAILSLTSAGENRFTGKYDDNTADSIPAVEGTFTCTPTDSASCELEYTITDGVLAVQTADGWKFTGTRAGVEGSAADENMDYLVFGIWLHEAQGENPAEDPNVVTFGAFANGGEAYDPSNKELKGKANYSGSAVGAHSKTDYAVSFFSGDAHLTADFDDHDVVTGGTAGSISGRISNIRVDGGPAMSQSIHLVKKSFETPLASFTDGDAVMGVQSSPGSVVHDFNGTWSASFYNNTIDDDDTSAVDEGVTTAPGAVAGTFGVSRILDMDTTNTKDDVTESFVGAFGAHFVEPDPMNGN